MISIALAVFVTQADAEPKDAINDHVRANIRIAVHSGSSGAVVRVVDANDKKARLHVEQMVEGTLPVDGDIEVPVRGFAKQDLARGTELLVFFRGQPGALTMSGHYELVF